jgi:hypothetical protein
MFSFIYVDIYHFYEPGIIEELMGGEAEGIEITEVFLLGATILMAITGIMVYLSLKLEPKINRLVNIIFSIIWVGILIGSLFVGEAWIHYIFATAVQVAIFSIIGWTAWKWPKQENISI